MPKYVYLCEKCNKEFQVFHSMKEKYIVCSETTQCDNNGSLRRIPSTFFTSFKETKQSHKAGDIVNKFIEDNKKELLEEKEILRNKEYEE